MNKDFCKVSPCNNCPYRKDAPLQHWSVFEFTKLIEKEKDQIGAVYNCHKKYGTACTGWLINQVQNNLPSILLRLTLLKNNITADFLETLKCKSPMYASVIDMCKANYPEHFQDL